MVGGSPSNRVPDRCAEAGVWACVQPSGARVPRPRRGGTRRHDPSLPQSRVTGPASAPIANDRGPPIASTRKPRFPSPPAAAHRGRHAAPRPPDVRRARCAGQRTRMDVESEESDGAASAAVLRARRRSLRRRRRAGSGRPLVLGSRGVSLPPALDTGLLCASVARVDGRARDRLVAWPRRDRGGVHTSRADANLHRLGRE